MQVLEFSPRQEAAKAKLAMDRKEVKTPLLYLLSYYHCFRENFNLI